MVLSYVDENGKRVTPTKSTGLPVKGNKKRAEALLNDWRKSEEIAIERRKASGTLKNPNCAQDILFTQFIAQLSLRILNAIIALSIADEYTPTGRIGGKYGCRTSARKTRDLSHGPELHR